MKDEIVDLLIRWEESMLNGNELSVSELCKECPEMMSELRESIDRFKGKWIEDSMLKGDELSLRELCKDSPETMAELREAIGRLNRKSAERN